MIEKAFVDTNILVYAHDLDAAVKRKTAQKILFNLKFSILSPESWEAAR